MHIYICIFIYCIYIYIYIIEFPNIYKGDGTTTEEWEDEDKWWDKMEDPPSRPAEAWNPGYKGEAKGYYEGGKGKSKGIKKGRKSAKYGKRGKSPGKGKSKK